MLKLILNLCLLFFAESTFDGPRLYIDSNFISQDPQKQPLALKVFVIKHPLLNQIGDFNALINIIEHARYEPLGQLLKHFFAQSIWLRIDLHNRTETFKSFTLANQFPLKSVKIYDEEGRTIEFGAKDYPRLATPVPYFELLLKPGLSKFFLKIDSTGQAGIIHLSLFENVHFFEKINESVFNYVLVAIPIFLCIFQATLFLVLGSYKSMFLVLGVSGFLGLFMLLGGHDPLVKSGLYFDLTHLVPLFLGMGIIGINENFRYFSGIERKKNPFIVLGVDFFSILYLVLSLICTWDTSLVKGWMLIPAIIWPFHIYFASWHLRASPTIKENLIYILNGVPFAISAVVFVFMLGGILNFNEKILDLQYISLTYLMLSMSMVIALQTVSRKTASSRIRHAILLGKSVQDLIIPEKISWDLPQLHIETRYIPFRGMLSGDWIKVWEDQRGTKHFLIGDINGKGPKAALAVGVIAMTIHQVARKGADIPTCLEAVNSALHRIFGGKIITTATGISISSDHELHIYHAGGHGPYLIQEGHRRHFFLPGPSLGRGAVGRIPHQHFQLERGERVVAFSEGIATDFKAARLMLESLARRPNIDVHPTHLIENALKLVEHASESDDLALLFIEKKTA